MVLAPYAELHKSPQSAGDSRPTASQIVKDQGLTGKLAGKVFLVTGGTPGGVGFETARALLDTGADVFITARSHDKGEAAVKKLEAESTGKSKLGFVVMNLDSLESVRAGAQDFLRLSKTLNVLIENAGIMRCPPGTTQDGFEIQFGDLLGASSCRDALALINMLARPEPIGCPRIPYMAYGQSKTANIWMANEIEKRFSSKGLHAWSLHPGLIKTNLGRHIPGDVFQEQILPNPELMAVLKSPEQGAATSVWAALATELEGLGGKYLENCQVVAQLRPDAPARSGPNIPGHAPHAYDDEGQKRLWEESLKMTGTAEA